MQAAYLFDNAGRTLAPPSLDLYILRDTCIRRCRSRVQSLSSHLLLRSRHCEAHSRDHRGRSWLPLIHWGKNSQDPWQEAQDEKPREQLMTL